MMLGLRRTLKSCCFMGLHRKASTHSTGTMVVGSVLMAVSSDVYKTDAHKVDAHKLDVHKLDVHKG